MKASLQWVQQGLGEGLSILSVSSSFKNLSLWEVEKLL